MVRQQNTDDKSRSSEAYVRWMEKDVGGLIDDLRLGDSHKQMLKIRWLDQVTWFERQSIRTRRCYYGLRLTAIVGGIFIPICLTLSQMTTLGWVSWVAAGLGILVAVASATEELFHHGERWRNYRNTAELLKIEGWQFFQMCGPYRRRKSLADAYEKFAARVEEIIYHDVQIHISNILGEHELKDNVNESENESKGESSK